MLPPSRPAIAPFVLWTAAALLPEGSESGVVPAGLGDEITRDPNALEDLGVERRGSFREAVEHPRPSPVVDDEAHAAQIGEVARGGGLRDAQDRHQVPHAKRS